MFEVKDKDGQGMFLRDRVSYEVPQGIMGDLTTKEGYIICFLSEGLIEVQPDDKGEPIILPADSTKVVSSLVQDVANLSTYVEFQLLLQGVESRYEEAVLHTAKKPRTKAEGGTVRVAKQVKAEAEKEVEF